MFETWPIVTISNFTRSSSSEFPFPNLMSTVAKLYVCIWSLQYFRSTILKALLNLAVYTSNIKQTLTFGIVQSWNIYGY